MTTDTVGGVWTYSLALARQLEKLGIEVCLATMGKNMSGRQKEEVADISNIRVFESDFRLEWMDDPWDDLEKAGSWLLRLEEELDADLVHLNSYAFASLPWIRPVLLVCHSCVYTWWQDVKGERPGDGWKRYFQLVKNGLRSNDRLVAVSHSYAREMARCYDLPLQNIRVIYNGLDSSDYAPSKKHPYVFGMGRMWDEGKNYRIAESLAPKIAWPVVLAGDMPASWRVAVQGDSHPAGANRLVFTGVLGRKDIRSRLAEASIFILPSFYEPFGLSALEAGLSGCALVLADIPTLREIWQESALYAPPGKPDKWIEQIDRLISDDNLRLDLAKKSRATALQFSAEKMAAGYLKLYNEILHSTLSPV